MATITIRTQILDGNLGDGWADNYAAAKALAEFTRSAWEADTAEFTAAGHTIEIEIDVYRNRSGCGRNVTVDTDDCDEDSYQLTGSIEQSLTDENTLWEKFCESETAANLS